MRPVSKWRVGFRCKNAQGQPIVITKKYKPHQEACEPLVDNIGHYCSYCEVFSSDLQVEHVIPVKQINDPQVYTGDLTKYDWPNFLLACARCNGRSNKAATYVYPTQILLPHHTDTYHPLVYKDSGEVVVNTRCNTTIQQKAQNLIDLVKLNRAPDEKPRDFRTRLRRQAWTKAEHHKKNYAKNPCPKMITHLIELATERGFFSVWYTVFQDYPNVQAALRAAFPNTNEDYF
ncbi:MAG: HNH endonuclease [Aureispira sp.]